MDKAVQICERAIRNICIFSAVIFLPIMICTRVLEILVRNVFNKPSGIYGSIESEAFFLLIFLSIAYTYTRDAHVRVDVLRDRMPPVLRAIIELLGALFFAFPFIGITLYFSIDRITAIAEIGQRSSLAFGQPLAWIVYSALPVGIGLFGLAVAVAMVRNILFLYKGKGPIAPIGKGLQVHD